MLSLLFAFCSSFEANFTYMNVTVKYGIERVDYAYFGSSINPRPAINLTYTGHVELPEAVQIGNRTYLFMMVCDFAFANTSITSISFPSPLRWISKSAFENCTNLRSLDLTGINVSALGERCFWGCKNLVNFTFPKSILYIGPSCFESIQLPHFPVFAFEDIGSKAFANNVQIKEADMSLCKFRTINEGLFENCTNLANIIFPKNLFWIRTRAFANTSLTFQKIPAMTKLVHKYIYADCLNVIEADFTDYPLKCISDGMFYNCINLKKVKLPAVCYWIGSYAFYNTSIEKLELRNMMHTVGSYAFAECTKLSLIDMSSTVIDAINDGVFYNCKELSYFKVSHSVKYIGANPFAQTRIPFADLEFPALEKLNSSSFVNSSIQKINFGASTRINELPEKLFFNMKTLTTVTLPPNLEKIQASAFSGSHVNNMKFPRMLKFINESAFANCEKLVEVDLSDTKIKNITKSSFENCHRLLMFQLPYAVEFIEDRAFFDCATLASVKFPNTLKMIGSFAFCQCSSITSCMLKDTDVRFVLDSAFENCLRLREVDFPNSMLGTGYKAFAGTAIENVVIPNSVGSYCFYECKSLQNVDMSKSGVQTLTSHIFGNCKSLKLVKLPSNIKTISKSVFSGCENLKEVYYNGQANFEEGVFPNDVKFVSN